MAAVWCRAVPWGGKGRRRLHLVSRESSNNSSSCSNSNNNKHNNKTTIKTTTTTKTTITTITMSMKTERIKNRNASTKIQWKDFFHVMFFFMPSSGIRRNLYPFFLWKKNLRFYSKESSLMVAKKKRYKCKNASWVHMHTTSKRIELETPGCSGVEWNWKNI